MTSFRSLMPALVAASLSVPVAADALILRADFTGVATAQQSAQWPPRPPEYYEGQRVTGFLEVNVVEPLYHQVGDYYHNISGTQQLSYTVRDQTFAFDNSPGNPFEGDPSVLLLSSYMGRQSITFMSNIFPKYDGGSFTVSGASGSLFDGVDPTTLRLTPGADYSFSTGFASAAASMWFGVALDSMNFRVITPVPEPSIALLLIGGGAALAWQRRRRSAAPAPAL
jgi:PEP-CTERM motif-containing protein